MLIKGAGADPPVQAGAQRGNSVGVLGTLNPAGCHAPPWSRGKKNAGRQGR